MSEATPPASEPHDHARALRALGGRDLLAALDAALLEAPLIPVEQRSLTASDDPTGDHILNPDFAAIRHDGGLKPAAVLIAVDGSAIEPDVVLTVRTAHLSAHAGQIAFPGGRIDRGETPQGAALREAFEEIALPPSLVAVRGFLPSYASRTGYRVYPVVGQVQGWPHLRPNPGEVAALFRVPLRFLLDPVNAVRETRLLEGRERAFYSYTHENRVIWGLTAGIIHHMSARVLSMWR